jgi:hypothetical protein
MAQRRSSAWENRHSCRRPTLDCSTYTMERTCRRVGEKRKQWRTDGAAAFGRAKKTRLVFGDGVVCLRIGVEAASKLGEVETCWNRASARTGEVRT